MNTYIIKELKILCKKAIKKKEVPVAALIIKNNKIIGKAYNKRENSNNPLDHAEIIAIIKATKKLKTWKLNDCYMYVTLKPCKMCEEIIKQSRIEKVYYVLDSKEYENNTKIDYEQIKNDDDYFKTILTTFFKNKR